FLREAENKAQQEAYKDRIFELYDEIDQCYPQGGYIQARKAFDLYYKYPERADTMEIYRMFKNAIDTDGLDTPDFVLNPFTSLLVKLYFEDRIDMVEAQKYQKTIRAILEKGLEDCQGVGCERWGIVQSYTPSRLEAFETVKGFYDCEYYIDKYYQEFEAAPNDCEVVRMVYSRLNWGECQKMDERFARLIEVGNTNCAPEPGPAEVAYDCYKNADYDCAIEAYEKAAAEAEEAGKKGRYLMTMAKIYQTHLKNFPRSRQYALQAAEARPNWGEPYIHIGRLYASSGPLCGPGRGWDSQIVVWPAIDMWNKAKQVDPEFAAEANRFIRQYRQYMPNNEDLHMRNKKEGESFYVGCWIQETTRIRTSD
ncbi:MAG: hypothetical protein R3350_05645, partial [Saprospiraceae bacterium]|nr:hypothetical protein [Saprospiraceae bacterium]